MTRSTNMEHVEVLRRMRNEWPLATDEGPALDAAIASLSAPKSEGDWVLVPRELLEAAVCPMKESGCDGVQYPVPPHGEAEQCQWCYERNAALSASQPPADQEWPHQDWKGMDGAIAWHLIDRHASGWEAVGEMMDAWLAAN